MEKGVSEREACVVYRVFKTTGIIRGVIHPIISSYRGFLGLLLIVLCNSLVALFMASNRHLGCQFLAAWSAYCAPASGIIPILVANQMFYQQYIHLFGGRACDPSLPR